MYIVGSTTESREKSDDAIPEFKRQVWSATYHKDGNDSKQHRSHLKHTLVQLGTKS